MSQNIGIAGLSATKLLQHGEVLSNRYLSGTVLAEVRFNKKIYTCIYNQENGVNLACEYKLEFSLGGIILLRDSENCIVLDVLGDIRYSVRTDPLARLGTALILPAYLLLDILEQVFSDGLGCLSGLDHESEQDTPVPIDIWQFTISDSACNAECKRLWLGSEHGGTSRTCGIVVRRLYLDTDTYVWLFMDNSNGIGFFGNNIFSLNLESMILYIRPLRTRMRPLCHTIPHTTKLPTETLYLLEDIDYGLRRILCLDKHRDEAKRYTVSVLPYTYEITNDGYLITLAATGLSYVMGTGASGLLHAPYAPTGEHYTAASVRNIDGIEWDIRQLSNALGFICHKGEKYICGLYSSFICMWFSEDMVGSLSTTLSALTHLRTLCPTQLGYVESLYGLARRGLPNTMISSASFAKIHAIDNSGIEHLLPYSVFSLHTFTFPEGEIHIATVGDGCGSYEVLFLHGMSQENDRFRLQTLDGGIFYIS